MSYFDQAYADLPAEWLNEPDAGYVSCLFARCKVINCFFSTPAFSHALSTFGQFSCGSGWSPQQCSLVPTANGFMAQVCH